VNYDLTSEQQMLVESIQRYIEHAQPFAARRQRVRDGVALDRSAWKTFAEMGWFAAGLSEADGGLGGGAIESALVAEQLAIGQILEPYILCGMLPLRLLQGCSNESAATLAARLLTGEAVIAVALSESNVRGDFSRLTATASPVHDKWILNGHKTLVVGGREADTYIFPCVRDDASRAFSMFLVDSRSAGVSCCGDRLMDWSSGCDVHFENVQVGRDALLSESSEAQRQLQFAVDEAIVGICAEAVGVMQGTVDMTTEYLKTRRQFGVPIGRFQALQHRLADMAIALVQGRSSLYRALQALGTAEETARSAQISGCKSLICEAARWVAAQGIQLHGAIGLTEEYPVGHYFKRMLVLDAVLGGQQYHLRKYAQWMAATAPQFTAGKVR
jgi:alkylation response protein AidB-like acyl-CoA dehydrogenase